jgi:hypothetical protein
LGQCIVVDYYCQTNVLNNLRYCNIFIVQISLEDCYQLIVSGPEKWVYLAGVCIIADHCCQMNVLKKLRYCNFSIVQLSFGHYRRSVIAVLLRILVRYSGLQK